MEQSILFALVLLLALAAYWSLVIFPRQRAFQKQQNYVQTLKQGDEMITYGGIIGKVIEVRSEEGIALVEVAPGVTVRVLVQSLIQPFEPEKLAEAARRAQNQSDV